MKPELKGNKLILVMVEQNEEVSFKFLRLDPRILEESHRKDETSVILGHGRV